MRIINQKYKNLQEHAVSFRLAQPFPHLVLDNFIDKKYFNELSRLLEKTGKDTIAGKSFDTEVEANKWISLNSKIPGLIQKIIAELNSEAWVKNMRGLTQIPDLKATEHGNTKLANYHEMNRGGILGPHVDHSHEPELGLPHVLNIIVYLSSKWNAEDGGATSFFDPTGANVAKKITYQPNRAVIFLHTPYSFHGVERISQAAPVSRKTIYVDYYSASDTPYKTYKLNFPAIWFKHGTTFKMRSFFSYLKYKNWPYLKTLVRYKLAEAKAKMRAAA